MQRSSSRGGSKPSASKKGYRNKAAQLEVAVRDKVNCLARLQVRVWCAAVSLLCCPPHSRASDSLALAQPLSGTGGHSLIGTCCWRSCCLTAAVQSEAVFLRQKGSVLEQLLEVASEVAVHKRQHTGTKFPDLSDPQLLDFLEKFLDGYGGFAAERPTAHNYFNLQR